MDAGANGKAGWRECRGRTLLGAAAYGDKMVRTLLSAGATAARGADDSCRAFMVAGADPSLRDRVGHSPLHLAAVARHHRVAGMLLLKGSDVVAKTAYRDTPLHLAAFKGQALCISELLLGGADKDVVDDKGETALLTAEKINRLEAVEELLSAGANHRMLSNNTRSPLEVAANGGHGNVAALHCAAVFVVAVRDNGDAVRALLGAGADVNVEATNNICFTPLHLAACHRIASDGTIRALLEGGANINACTEDETPLHEACWHLSVAGVELLLHWGADEKLTNDVGDTPADVIGTRSWRRRGWLVLSRYCQTRVNIANRSSSSGNSGNSAKVARASGEDAGRRDEETADQMMVDLRDLVGRLVGLEAGGLFRLVVGFL
ncbi:unnamed protein product [Ectocarpus sp. CCAP 1310/34]|nr:unnamed protein product [Ectocarpus sp. CCAP 1310/34]